MKVLVTASAALFLLVLACGDDTTAPSGPFSLSLSTELRDASIDLSDEQPYLCRYKCVAKTEGGEAGEYADWIGGRIDWLVADTVVFSYPLDASDLLDRFGSTSIGRNKKQDFVRSATATDPYDLRIVISALHSSGEVLTDSSVVTCAFPPDVMSPSNLAGLWSATWMKYLSSEAIIWQYELLGNGGALSFTLSSDGTFSGATTYPNTAGEMTSMVVAGTLTVDESESVSSGKVTFNFTQGPFGTFSGTLTRVVNHLFLDVPEGASFDFSRDGVPQNAALEGRFTIY